MGSFHAGFAFVCSLPPFSFSVLRSRYTFSVELVYFHFHLLVRAHVLTYRLRTSTFARIAHTRYRFARIAGLCQRRTRV